MGCERGVDGVGLLVADRWIEKVLDVKHESEGLMVMRVIVGKTVLNLISVYAPDTNTQIWRKRNSSPYYGRM